MAQAKKQKPKFSPYISDFCNLMEEAQTAKIQAEKDKQVAEIAAQQAIVEAEAQAEVVRIAAEAEAAANREIAASLTPELIEKIKYEQWDGKMPTVSGGATPIIGIN